MGVKGYWGAGVFLVVLFAMVLSAILIPERQEEKDTGLPSSAEELIAAAKTLSVGAPESTILPVMGEPTAKREVFPGLISWSWGDVTIAVYKGKICGMEGCNLMTRGEMVPAELQTPENMKPKPLSPEGKPPAESAASANN
jgi:hypothetical protein